MVVKYSSLLTIRDHPFPKPSDRRRDVLMRRTARVGRAQAHVVGACGQVHPVILLGQLRLPG
jgi:hypothetical protein